MTFHTSKVRPPAPLTSLGEPSVNAMTQHAPGASVDGAEKFRKGMLALSGFLPSISLDHQVAGYNPTTLRSIG